MKPLASLLTVVAAGSLLAAPAPKDKGYYPIDIQKFGNKEVMSNFAGGDETNVLKDFPTGDKTVADVPFTIGKKLVVLGSTAQKGDPAKVEGIPVGRSASKLHFLHANGYGGGPNTEGSDLYVKDGTTIGAYVVHFEDGTKADIPMVYGEHTRDWFFAEGEAEPSKAKVAWTGENKFATDRQCKVRVYRMTWENPKPDKRITAIDVTGRKEETAGAPFVIAITAEVK
jgi:hypothetical protein